MRVSNLSLRTSCFVAVTYYAGVLVQTQELARLRVDDRPARLYDKGGRKLHAVNCKTTPTTPFDALASILTIIFFY
jgi:hypothetical protein